MKQVEGYVADVLLESFSEERIDNLTLFRKPFLGIKTHVTLSPIGQEPGPKKVRIAEEVRAIIFNVPIPVGLTGSEEARLIAFRSTIDKAIKKLYCHTTPKKKPEGK